MKGTRTNKKKSLSLWEYFVIIPSVPPKIEWQNKKRENSKNQLSIHVDNCCNLETSFLEENKHNRENLIKGPSRLQM